MSLREKTLELPRTISETIYLHLKKAIVSGELRPGQRVQEKDIAALFKVSSTPVREAFFRLAAERYLAINARKEVLVQGASIEEVPSFTRSSGPWTCTPPRSSPALSPKGTSACSRR